MKNAALAILAAIGAVGIFALFVLLSGLGCGFVRPIPTTPDAAVVDRFTGNLFDCHGQNLLVRGVALAAVRDCITGDDRDACLLRLPYEDRTIACAVRDEGAAANADVLAGLEGREVVADGARAWLTSRMVGFR